jgi:hypothetical protein
MRGRPSPEGGGVLDEVLAVAAVDPDLADRGMGRGHLGIDVEVVNRNPEVRRFQIVKGAGS